MSDGSHEQNKMQEGLHDLSVFAEKLDTRLVGLERLLDLHMSMIEKTLLSKDQEREELKQAVKDLEKRVSEMETTVAKLIGKWSIVIILITAIISVVVSANFKDVQARTLSEELPAAIPSKTEIRLGKSDEAIYVVD